MTLSIQYSRDPKRWNASEKWLPDISLYHLKSLGWVSGDMLCVQEITPAGDRREIAQRASAHSLSMGWGSGGRDPGAQQRAKHQ